MSELTKCRAQLAEANKIIARARELIRILDETRPAPVVVPDEYKSRLLELRGFVLGYCRTFLEPEEAPRHGLAVTFDNKHLEAVGRNARAAGRHMAAVVLPYNWKGLTE